MNRDTLAASIERRDHPRQNVLANISLYRPNSSRAYEGKIFNISKSGISCTTDMPLNIMSPVKIYVNQSTELYPDATFIGKVVWVKIIDDLNSGKYRYGIKLKPNA